MPKQQQQKCMHTFDERTTLTMHCDTRTQILDIILLQLISKMINNVIVCKKPAGSYNSFGLLSQLCFGIAQLGNLQFLQNKKYTQTHYFNRNFPRKK